jgi:hypothetical protein
MTLSVFIIVLLYWGYILTFTKVVTIYQLNSLPPSLSFILPPSYIILSDVRMQDILCNYLRKVKSVNYQADC